MIKFSEYCNLRESGDFQLTPEKTQMLSMLVRSINALGMGMGYTINSMNNKPQALPPEQQTPEARAAVIELFNMVKAASNSIPNDLIRDVPRLQRNARPILDWMHKFLSKALPYKKQFNFQWPALDQMHQFYLDIMK